MEQNLYERYAKIREIKGFTDYKVANLTGIGTPTISNWKKGKYQPKDDKMKKIAEVLEVSLEYLKGDVNYIKCDVCGSTFDLLWDEDREAHETFHQKFLSIKESFPFFMCRSEAERQKTDSIFEFRKTSESIENRLLAFDNYLQAAFSIEIHNNGCDFSRLNYEDFCKIEVSTLQVDYAITEEFIELLADKYGVDKDFLGGYEQLLARVSKNKQLMRILAYAEKLNPGMLDSIEIQIKALVENK